MKVRTTRRRRGRSGKPSRKAGQSAWPSVRTRPASQASRDLIRRTLTRVAGLDTVAPPPAVAYEAHGRAGTSIRQQVGDDAGVAGRDRWPRRPTTRASDRSAGAQVPAHVGGPDRERSTAEQLVFHAELPAADASGKAEKVVHKVHILLKNEW